MATVPKCRKISYNGVMNSKTQKLTFGAMLIAVFGVLILLNRQTGGLFDR